MINPTRPKTTLLFIILALCLFASALFAAVPVIDSSTIINKVLCGYQGWFACPGDGQNQWIHWSDDSSWIGPTNYHTDVWPDVTEYDPSDLFFVPNTTLTQGGTPYLFSDHRQGAVNVHFRWMMENNIDGAMVQRFVSGLPTSQSNDVVLQNAMHSAGIYGRTFCIEYDLSGTSDSEMFSKLTQDWTYLNTTFGISSNSRYQRHNGKPVVCLWGLVHDRSYTPANAMLVINWFKNNGVFIMGGVGGYWNSLSQSDPWYNVYRSFNAIQPWTVGGYSDWNGINNYKTNTVVSDLAECNKIVPPIVYMTVAWPRGGWDNMHDYPCGESKVSPRLGQHLWDQMYAYKSAGVPCQKIAMFDEYDESTAIMKLASNVPTSGCFWTSEGMPSDWWLRLAGQGSKMQRGEIAVSQTMPINSTVSPDDAIVVSDTIPASMNAGQQSSASVTFRNTGETTWSWEFFKLAPAGGADPFGGVKQSIPTGTAVSPGGEITFSFILKAPTHSGTYLSDWQMSHEKIRMFGAKLMKVITVGTGPVLTNTSTFNSNADGWIPTTWRANTTGSYGAMTWNSLAGSSGGGMRCTGASTTDNSDRCNREGAELPKTISTAGSQGIVVAYDVRVNALGNNNIGAGTGTCTVDHALIDEQLTVYFSTNGGTSWTEAETVRRGELKAVHSTYATRAIDLSGVAACNNNSSFRLRFRWQLNTSTDQGDLDNIKVYGNQIDVTPPAPLAGFATAGGNQQIGLTWTNPSDTDYTGAVIRYRTDTYPTSVNDGTLLVDKLGSPGSGDGFAHTGITGGGTYYYAAFAHDDGNHYGTAVTGSATTVPGVVEDWINESFDSYANGLLTDPKWMTVGEACAEVESALAKDGTGKATLMDAAASQGSIACLISCTDKTSGYCYLSFDVAQDAAGAAGQTIGYVTVYGSDSATEIARIHIQKGRIMVEYSTPTFAILTTSVTNLTWYNVKVGFNIDTRRMDFWLDGIPKGTGYDWKGAATSISGIVISSDRNTNLTTQKAYIDNLKLEPKLGQVTQVRDDGVWTPSLSKLHFSFDPVIYTSQYRYCIGTTSGGSQTRGWTVCGTSTDIMAAGLSLTENQNYYISVQCGDAIGNWGTSRTSDGIKPAPALASIPAAKALGDSATVYALKSKLVSGTFGNCFYIQEPNGPFGMKVISSALVSPGDEVDVAGFLSGSGSERYVDCTGNGILRTTPGPGGPRPLVMKTASVGGVELNAYTPGVVDGATANNIGLLVTVFGKVTQRQTTAPMYFYIDDGCGIKDGTTTGGVENVGIRISGDPISYAAGSYVTVTGTSSCFSASGLRPQIVPTLITILQP